MPKGKRKGGKSERGRNEGSLQTSDDESINDNYSVISNYSENHSADENADDVEELGQQVAYEEKLLEALEGLTQKSAQGRTSSFVAVRTALIKRYMSDFVYDRRMTISDGIERGLRKGRGEEQAVAAQLAPILCVQLGAGDASEELCKELKPILMTLITDASVSPDARGKCCLALALLAFLAGGEMAELVGLMQQFEAIFSGSYLKGDSSVPNITPNVGGLHAAALSAWTLLFTLMSPGDVYSLYNRSNSFSPSLVQLSELLTSGHLEVRLTAGEALAMVFGVGREFQDDFGEHFVPELIESLRQLATDSQKFRAKKDRKQQRATFRDILHYIEDDIFEPVQIKFGQEVLILDSWTKRKQYDALCHILGPGLNTHLAENELLRDIFQLGSRNIIQEVPIHKQTKLERHLINTAACKARTKSRNKNRDKRSDF